MSYSISEYSKMIRDIQAAGITDPTLVSAVLLDMGRDRRQQNITEERRAGRPQPRTASPSIEGVKAELGDDARLVDVEQDDGKIYVRISAGLQQDDFNRVVQRLRDIGARFDKADRRWEIFKEVG